MPWESSTGPEIRHSPRPICVCKPFPRKKASWALLKFAALWLAHRDLALRIDLFECRVRQQVFRTVLRDFAALNALILCLLSIQSTPRTMSGWPSVYSRVPFSRSTFQDKCKKFADKYIEHDFVVLFIDIILIKPQVYRHLLYNRLGTADDRLNVSPFQIRVDKIAIHPSTWITPDSIRCISYLGSGRKVSFKLHASTSSSS